jgi:hypothetical protein
VKHWHGTLQRIEALYKFHQLFTVSSNDDDDDDDDDDDVMHLII